MNKSILIIIIFLGLCTSREASDLQDQVISSCSNQEPHPSFGYLDKDLKCYNFPPKAYEHLTKCLNTPYECESILPTKPLLFFGHLNDYANSSQLEIINAKIDQTSTSDNLPHFFREIIESRNFSLLDSMYLVDDGIVMDLDDKTLHLQPKGDGFVATLKASLLSNGMTSTSNRKIEKLRQSAKNGDFDIGTLHKEKAFPSYSKERIKYILDWLEQMHRPPQKQTVEVDFATNNINKDCEDTQKITPSIIPFKKGDLDKMCVPSLITYQNLGLKTVSLFFPIHYSGGYVNNSEFDYPKNPTDGLDYRFETLQTPSVDELHRCLDSIFAFNFELIYVPHLESIVTINANSETDWRLFSLIPLGSAKYFELAYKGLITYLNQHQRKILKPVTIALAAEIDPSFILYTKDSLQLLSNIQNELQWKREEYNLSWHPNGDFEQLSGPHINDALEVECDLVLQLLRKIDIIAPSLYQNHNHVKTNSKQIPSFTASKNHFFARQLLPYLTEICRPRKPFRVTSNAGKGVSCDYFYGGFGEPFDCFDNKVCKKINENWDENNTPSDFCEWIPSTHKVAEIESIVDDLKSKFSIGELGLQIAPSHYQQFLQEATETGVHKIILWNDNNEAHDPFTDIKLTETIAQSTYCDEVPTTFNLQHKPSYLPNTPVIIDVKYQTGQTAKLTFMVTSDSGQLVLEDTTLVSPGIGKLQKHIVSPTPLFHDNGYPICSLDAIDGTDDSWGWENNQTCFAVKHRSAKRDLPAGRYHLKATLGSPNHPKSSTHKSTFTYGRE